MSTETFAQKIAKVKQNNPSLAKLNLQDGLADGMLDAAKLAELNTALQANEYITHIDLSCNKFADPGAEQVANLLIDNPNIQYINLWNCDITEIGAGHIARAIAANTSLRKLILSTSTIAAVGMQAIAAALKTNTNLQHIDLRGCVIDDAGVDALADSLCANTSLKHLDLRGNQITSVGATQIAYALRDNTGILLEILLENNPIDNKFIASIQRECDAIKFGSQGVYDETAFITTMLWHGEDIELARLPVELLTFVLSYVKATVPQEELFQPDPAADISTFGADVDQELKEIWRGKFR